MSAPAITIPPLSYKNAALPTDAAHFGLLRESNDIRHDRDALQQRMKDDGYLLIRGLLDRDAVLEARLQILSEMAKQGFLDPSRPVMDGIHQPGAHLHWGHNQVTEAAPKVRDVLYGPDMMGFFDFYFGEPALHYDFTWFRCKVPSVQQATNPHYDVVYMGRGEVNQAHTVWTPYGDTPLQMGGLMVLEGSHKHPALRQTYGQFDVDSSCKSGAANNHWTGHGSYGTDAREVQQELGGRWLSTDYRAGDVLIFSFYLMHAAPDNLSDRIRLSTDSRYQVARGARDDRWFGEHPIGHGKKAHRELIC